MNDPQAGAIRRLETELETERKARIAERDRIEFLTKALDQAIDLGRIQMFHDDEESDAVVKCWGCMVMERNPNFQSLVACLKEKQAP